jgi:hypothetical protein
LFFYNIDYFLAESAFLVGSGYFAGSAFLVNLAANLVFIVERILVSILEWMSSLMVSIYFFFTWAIYNYFSGSYPDLVLAKSMYRMPSPN